MMINTDFTGSTSNKRRGSLQRRTELLETSCSIILKSRRIMCVKKNGAILGRLYFEIRKRHYINCYNLDSPTHTVSKAAARDSTLRSSIRIIVIYLRESYIRWITFLFQKSGRQPAKGSVNAKLKLPYN